VKHYLHVADYILWVTAIVAQIVLFLQAIRRHLWHDVPRFIIYLGFLSLESLALIFVSSFLSYKAYCYAYYGGTVIEAIFFIAVAYEVFLKVFEPLRALPSHTTARIVCSILVASILAVTIAISISRQELGPIWSVLYNLRIAVGFVVCLSFWLVVVYAWLLKLAWWSRITFIASGFLFYLSGQALLYVLIWSLPDGYRAPLMRLKGIIYLVGLGFWFKAVWTKQVSFGQASLEDLLKLRTFVDEMRLAALRLRNLPKRERPNEQ
jgi:hypothetical protein